VNQSKRIFHSILRSIKLENVDILKK